MANEKQLVIEVRDKIATLKSKNFNLVGGNSDYDVVFDFDDDWEDYPTKTAVFVFGKGVPVFQIFEGNVCKGVAINGATMCLIGAFAGDIKTTTSAEVECVYKSILDDANGTPEPPTEDVYNQIMDLLNKYIEQGGGGSGGSAVSPTVEITPIENGHRVTITDINGKHPFDVLNGEKGEKGDTGKGFEISKTYPSIEAMNAGFATDGVPENSFVLIDTGNVEDEDNAKLFIKTKSGYSYLTDLSGAQGIKGEKGADGKTPQKGVDYWTPTDKAEMVQEVLKNFVDVSEVGQ